MMTLEQIREYWEGRAAGDDSVQSTTQDVFLRQIELDALKERIRKHCPRTIADIGCGDGRTTIGLARTFEAIHFTGFDYATAMVTNAKRVLASQPVSNVTLEQADIREGLTDAFDLIYTTRCLINLPSWDLQRDAIRNIHTALKPGGVYLMVENFVEGQNNLNQIRKGYQLPEIPIRDHNCFFSRQSLLGFTDEFYTVDEEVNISSTYYLVSRIIYAKICARSGTIPDYFDEHHRYAVHLPYCGEYGPVRLISFVKK